jgi:hypothetical protein
MKASLLFSSLEAIDPDRMAPNAARSASARATASNCTAT